MSAKREDVSTYKIVLNVILVIFNDYTVLSIVRVYCSLQVNLLNATSAKIALPTLGRTI